MSKSTNMPDSLCALPEGYQKAMSIDLTEDMALLKRVSLWSVRLFLACVLLLAPPVLFRLFAMGDILYYIGPTAPAPFSPRGFLGFLFIGLAMQMVVILLHEGVHGLFFKRYAPEGGLRFGFEKGMAYAGCPGAYFSKKAYRVIGLAPLVALSLPSYGMLFVCSVGRLWGYAAVAFVFLLNTSGAAGDLYTWSKLRSFPEDSYWLDTDTGCEAYVRGE